MTTATETTTAAAVPAECDGCDHLARLMQATANARSFGQAVFASPPEAAGCAICESARRIITIHRRIISEAGGAPGVLGAAVTAFLSYRRPEWAEVGRIQNTETDAGVAYLRGAEFSASVATFRGVDEDRWVRARVASDDADSFHEYIVLQERRDGGEWRDVPGQSTSDMEAIMLAMLGRSQ